MTETIPANNPEKNRVQFDIELKLFLNQKLYDKHIITEDMYWNAKELLLKQAG